ncbi:MAG TPA: hypothetical protein ENF73_00495, partial [Proteobacteria bacterium]|nr:hypothetical protein [Pseudomonadota bacterium]
MEPYIRDTRKLRDKIEIAIDPRQIALLVIGEVLLLVLVFILGFGIGRSQRAKPQADLAQQIGQPEEQQMIVEQGTKEVQPATEQGEPPQEAESEPPRDELTLPPDEQPVYTVDLSDDSGPSMPQIAASEPSPPDEQSLVIELPAQEQQERQVDQAEPTPGLESGQEQEPTT